MSRHTRRALLAGCGALLAGCTAPTSTGWAATPTPVPASSLADSPLAARWQADLPGQYTLSRPAAGDHLYVASRRELFAFDRVDGTRAWTATLGALSHGFPPVVDDGTVLAGARDVVDDRRLVDRGGTPTLAAFTEAGAERWRVNRPLGASPTVADGTVFLPETTDEGAALRALALDTGETRWHRSVDADEAFTEPAVAGGNVYLVVRDGERSHLSSFTRGGEERWRAGLDGTSHRGPAAAAGRVAVGTDTGTVTTFDADGTERWRAGLDGGVSTTPALASDRTYAATERGVTALGPDGERRWRGVVDSVGKTGVTVADGVVHLGGNEVAGFDAATGEPRWRVKLPGLAGTFGAPLVRDGVVHTGACIKTEGNSRYDHVVYALA
jgi:outer membrane protein assembly factor BamB